MYITFKGRVYDLVRKIPKGKVATYGQVALMLERPRGGREVGWPRTELTFRRDLRSRTQGAFMRGKLLARAVGNALHKNTDLSVPCHRVVDRNGRLAPNFGGPSLESFGRRAFSTRGGPAFGWDGWMEQKRRLMVEGVQFDNEMHVDLAKCLWQA